MDIVHRHFALNLTTAVDYGELRLVVGLGSCAVVVFHGEAVEPQRKRQFTLHFMPAAAACGICADSLAAAQVYRPAHCRQACGKRTGKHQHQRGVEQHHRRTAHTAADDIGHAGNGEQRPQRDEPPRTVNGGVGEVGSTVFFNERGRSHAGHYKHV